MKSGLSGRTTLLLLSFALSGCDEGMPGDRYVVSDSAGIRIVESSAALWTAGEAWQLAAEPTTVIGAGATPDDQLFEVLGVDRLSSGEIVVANGGSQEIRLYSTEGELLQTLGGRGEGPGEFTTLSAVHVTAGDTIVALNQVPLRVSRFTAEAGLLRDRALGHDRESRWIDAYPLGLVGSAHLLVWGYPDYLDPRFQDGYYHEPLPWGLLDLETGSVQEGGQFPGYEMMLEHMGSAVRPLLIPFSHTGDVTSADSAVLMAPNDGFRILKHRLDGTLEEEWRYPRRPRAVTEEAVREWIDLRVAGFGDRSDPRVAEAVRTLEELRPPDVFPQVNGLESDRLGYTWVREFQWPPSDPIRFTVFDPDGRVLGRVLVPGGLDGANGPQSKSLLIGAAFFLGVWKNDLDVEEVRLYPLRR